MGQFISKEEGPVAEKNFMDLPDEILLKIMGYLSNKDVLKNVGQVSKRFHRLSRDPFLIKKIEFKILEFTYQWTDERKEKYFNDFFEVLKNSQNLKFLSLQLDHQSLGKIFPSGNHQCLEEIYIQVRNVELDLCPDYLENDAFKVLDQCPKLNILKIDICYLGREIQSHFLLRKISDISILISQFRFGNLQELHVNFLGCNPILSDDECLKFKFFKKNIFNFNFSLMAQDEKKIKFEFSKQ